MGYVQASAIKSFRIVRSQTPKRSANCRVVLNRALHRYSQIACLRSDGPNYLTSSPRSVVLRIKQDPAR